MENNIVRYFVESQSGEIVGGPYSELATAVLDAATYDGWGGRFQRDEAGDMRLYSSKGHVGNNNYFPAEGDEFFPASSKTDEGEAIAEVALEVFKRGVLHSRYQMAIVTVTYDNAGQVETINGDTLTARNEYMDDPAETSAQDAKTFALA
ncbi:MAG: hypothetical protein M0Z99_13045 [Betaproteobacteria bacterium]|nr:hypothetical protein [Betaproteobacteria bacterium]